MANYEHVAKIKEGVKSWNLWRKENQTIPLKISGFVRLQPDKTTGNSKKRLPQKISNFSRSRKIAVNG